MKPYDALGTATLELDLKGSKVVVSLGTCQKQIQVLLMDSTFILGFELYLQIFVSKYNGQHTVEDNPAHQTATPPG